MSLTKDFFDRETNITAKVICDSISEAGDRITTLEIEYPRFILAEVNTHKALEKNSSSSRAIPIKTMLEQIEANMAEPVYWGKNKSGMQADSELDLFESTVALSQWIMALNDMEHRVQELVDIGLHKQTVNRLLEPFQMMKTVITGTDWDNFFNLRIHPDAQPEFCMLAYKIYKAMEASIPYTLKHREWHLPYVEISKSNGAETYYYTWDIDTSGTETDGYQYEQVKSLDEAIRISASCCAQTSYRKNDNSLEKADKVFDLLMKADVLHASPFSHLATPIVERLALFDPSDDETAYEVNLPHHIDSWDDGITHMRRDGKLCSGNLTGWISYRHLIPNNTCYNFDFDKRMELFK